MKFEELNFKSQISGMNDFMIEIIPFEIFAQKSLPDLRIRLGDVQ